VDQIPGRVEFRLVDLVRGEIRVLNGAFEEADGLVERGGIPGRDVVVKVDAVADAPEAGGDGADTADVCGH
jgi:hypothetical protein